MPVDPASLVALGALAAPGHGQSRSSVPHDAETVALTVDRTAPAPVDHDRAAAPAGALGAASLAFARLREAGSGLLPDSDTSRRRTAVLAGGSVAAGLLAGLLVPAAAEAQAPAPSSALTVATASPFAGVERPTVVAAPRPTSTVAARRAPSPSPASAPPSRAAAAAVVVDPRPPHRAFAPSAAVVVVASYRPTRPLPARSGSGRRIVYAERAAHLWIVGADGQVLRDYKVTGRVDRPKPGVYHVYSKSPTAVNPGERLTFDLMVRFAYGVTGARIGFHTIPRYYDGRPIQAEKDLGRAIGMGGCVRQSRADARWLYAWSRVGDTVVVLH